MASTAAAPVATTRGEQRAWYMYDWANSVFPTTVVTTFLGPYLTALAKNAADANGMVYLAGLPMDARSVWGYAVAASVICQVLVLPPLGAYADYGHRKREMLGVLAYLGAFATVAMYFLEGSRWLFGVGLFMFANTCFGGAQVIYNSFLPEISSPEERDSVSSRGWGIGYLGGGIALALNLALYLNAEKLGLSGGQAVRISLASAGVWWAAFTLIPFFGLRNRRPERELAAGERMLTVSFRELAATIRSMRRFPETMKFLAAYLLYNDAIQAVIALATQFASDELKIPMSNLTAAILMVQFMAFFGAMGFNVFARRIGGKAAVMTSLVIWTGVLVYIYSLVRTTQDFFIAAAGVAIVMGGSQALSRSLFSQLIPNGREAQYFSLYEVSDKGTSWLAPLFFGLALQLTRSYRLSILSLIVFFIAGFIGLSFVNFRKGAKEASA